MIGAEHDRIALEELVRPARGVEESADRRVHLLERLVGLRGRPVARVRCVVEVREVVGEEVEAVSRHEPAPDGGGVRVDRAGGAVAHRERRSRLVGLEEAVEEEALRPVRGAVHAWHRR